MSWSQWPGSNVPQSGHPPPNVAPSIPTSQYTAEQWAQMQHQNWQQWMQWQQQFQLWQQQYGAEYQKSMNAIAQASMPVQPPAQFLNAPPPPAETKPPPPPDEPLGQATSSGFPMNVPPPPRTASTSTAALPSQLRDNKFQQNRLNPSLANANNFSQFDSNQQKLNRNQNYTNQTVPNMNWQNQNQINKNQAPLNRFNQPSSVRNEIENKFELGMKRPGIRGPEDDTKRNKVDSIESKQEPTVPARWSEGQSKNASEWVDAPTLTPTKPNNEELSEAEKKFDKQFNDWEAQFQKWKEQNANHPDKEQYREYEKKWEVWRSQLLERREQMKRKRLGLPNNIPQLIGDKVQNKLESDKFPTVQSTQAQPRVVSQPSSLNTGLPLEVTKTQEPTKQAKPELTKNVTKPFNAGFLRPPPNLNNQPLEFKKADESFGVEMPNEDKLGPKFKEEDSNFFKSTPSGGIPGLDLVKDSTETEDTPEPSKVTENSKPDLEAISRGINSILGDQKLMSILSKVSQNQSRSFTSTGPPKVDSPKFSPTEYNDDEFDDYESQHLKFAQLDEASAYDQYSELNSDVPLENYNEDNVSNDGLDQNRDIGRYGSSHPSFNKNIGNTRSNEVNKDSFGGHFNKGPDYIHGRPSDFNKNFDNFERNPNAQFRSNPNSNWNQGSGAREVGNLRSDLGKNINQFNTGPGNCKDNFNRFVPNLNRGPNIFNRDVDNFRGPENFNRGCPDSFNVRGPDNFNRGTPDNFIRGPDNFNRNSDNFNKGPDNFNRGSDHFNRGFDNFSRGPDNFNRCPENINKGSENFKSGPNNFNRGNDSFRTEAMPFSTDNFEADSRKGRNFGQNKFNQDPSIFNRNLPNFNEDRENLENRFNPFNKYGNLDKSDKLLNKESPLYRNPDNIQQPPNILKEPYSRFSNKDFNASVEENIGSAQDFIKRPELSNVQVARDVQNNFINNSNNLHFGNSDRFSILMDKSGDFNKGNFNSAASENRNPPSVKREENLVPPRPMELPNVIEKENLNRLNQASLMVTSKTSVSSNVSQCDEVDEGIWKTKNVIDYDHKSLVTDELDIILEPFYTFDYRNKPLNRIPFPSRPKWLTEMFGKYPEFDLGNLRNSRSMDYRPYPTKGRFESGYYKYEDRGRKPYDDRNRRPLDDFDRERKMYEDRNRKVFDDKERRNYDDKNRKIREDKERRNYDSKDKKSYEDKNAMHEDNVRHANKSREENVNEYDTNFDDFEDDEMEFESPKSQGKDKPEEVMKQSDKTVKQLDVIPSSKSNVLLIEDILTPPGRYTRPPRIVIILRGPPGSGKSFLAKLIKDKEVENGGSAPRILCLDDYFMVEQEREVEEDGRKTKIKEMVYEYEEEMEGIYRQSLMKSFKKTITDGYFSFIIVDNINDKVKYFGEMWSFAKQNGFQVYICQMELDVQICTKRNIHGRSESEIQKCVSSWEQTPSHHPVLDATSLIQSGSIPEVEMEEINSPLTDNINEEERLIASKWDNFDYSIDNLAKLDGTNKPLRPNRTMEDYLQLDDDWIQPVSSKPGQKRVRWADLEERKEQEKMRAIGFVVGQTNWDRMMDPTMGSSALTQTKYIERYKK